MRRTFFYFSVTLFAALLTLMACSNSAVTSAAIASFGCTATGTSLTGTVATSTTAQYSNVQIQVYNGIGPFTFTIPGGSTVTSATSTYVYPGTVTTTAGAPITVLDTGSSASTTCALNSGSSIGLYGYSTGAVTISPSPSTTAAVGTSITLSAYTSTVSAASYTFTLATQVVGVTLYQTSATTATVTSSIPTTVTVIATAVGVSSAYATETGQLSLVFTGSTYGYNYGTTGALQCAILRNGGTFYPGVPLYFQVVSVSTGEPLLITSWNPGEQWAQPPAFPMIGPWLQISYSYPGTKSVVITAQSQARPGVVCNTMTDTIYVNP